MRAAAAAWCAAWLAVMVATTILAGLPRPDSTSPPPPPSHVSWKGPVR